MNSVAANGESGNDSRNNVQGSLERCIQKERCTHTSAQVYACIQKGSGRLHFSTHPAMSASTKSTSCESIFILTCFGDRFNICNVSGMSEKDTNANGDIIKDFQSTGRTGRRNAMADVLGAHKDVSTSDLPLKLEKLSTNGEYHLCHFLSQCSDF